MITLVGELCSKLPREFGKCLSDSRSFNFRDKPFILALKIPFKKMLSKKDIEVGGKFDHTTKKGMINRGIDFGEPK